MNVNDVKKQLRQKAHANVLRLTDDEKIRKSELAVNNLLKLLSAHSSFFKVIGFFSPMKDEVKWTLFKENFKQWTLAFPMMKGETLEFFTVENSAIHNWGADFPENFQKIKAEPDLIIVPGLSFTKEGTRLGRGKGFYDRFLHSYQGVKIGLCFDEQLELEIPTEAHDVLMNFIVTDNDIYYV